MVLHQVKRMKMLYREEDIEKFEDLKASYFALMWVPSNTKDGMNEDELNILIEAIERANYFVKKLDEEAVYISGPLYGDNESQHGYEEPQDENEEFPRMRSCSNKSGYLRFGDQVNLQEVKHQISNQNVCLYSFVFDALCLRSSI